MLTQLAVYILFQNNSSNEIAIEAENHNYYIATLNHKLKSCSQCGN